MDVEPRLTPVSRISVKRKIDELYAEEQDSFLSNISSIFLRKPSVTVDFWTARDGHSFLGCIVHYIVDGILHTSFELKLLE